MGALYLKSLYLKVLLMVLGYSHSMVLTLLRRYFYRVLRIIPEFSIFLIIIENYFFSW